MDRNNIGRDSLIVSVFLLVVLEGLIYIGYLENEYWSIASFGFEAATIGGLADWFAVNALFNEIPIPFLKNHTNIIVKNRTKLSKGIVDLVTNKWLSIEVLKGKTVNITVTDHLIEALSSSTNKDKIKSFLRASVIQIIDNNHNSDGINKLQLILKEQLNTVDYNSILSAWLYKLVQRGEHYSFLNFIINKVEKGIGDKRTEAFLFSMVDKKVKGYEKETLIKGLAVKIASATGMVDSDLIVKKILVAINDFVYELKSKDKHPLKIQYTAKVVALIDNLKKGDLDAESLISDFKQRVINIEEIKDIIKPAWEGLREETLNKVKDEGSVLDVLLNDNIEKALVLLKTDVVLKEKINNSIKSVLNSLIDKYHKEVGDLIETSLAKLNDKELVNQIESKVGNDLQYIRLNGAIVGGFIGLVFAFIRIKFLHH